jgi:3-oxoadipate enol-lactonase
MKELFFAPRGLYYRTNDIRPDRQTLVFVHGVSASSSAWVEYEKTFESEYNIVSLDLRGHGKSYRYPRYKDYTVASFADDIYVLLSFLNIKKSIIVSHSFGTLVTLDFVSHHEDMVSALVFLSPNYHINRTLFGSFLVGSTHLLDICLPCIPHTPHRHIDYSRFHNTGDWNVRRLLTDISNTGFRVYLYSIAQTYGFNAKKTLQRMSVPTLIIHGKKDTIFNSRHAEEMSHIIPHATLHLIDSADHIIVLNNASYVVTLIEQFIKNIER